jgi:hypothetical protein
MEVGGCASACLNGAQLGELLYPSTSFPEVKGDPRRCRLRPRELGVLLYIQRRGDGPPVLHEGSHSYVPRPFHRLDTMSDAWSAQDTHPELIGIAFYDTYKPMCQDGYVYADE